MSHSASELRALRRSFMNDCETAIKGFNGTQLLPGQSPEKLFEDALIAHEKVTNAYKEVIDSLIESGDDADKLEDSKDVVDGINAKLEALKALHETFKLENPTPINASNTSDSEVLKNVLLEEARLLDIEEEYKCKLAKQKRLIEVHKKIADCASTSKIGALGSLSPKQYADNFQSTPKGPASGVAQKRLAFQQTSGLTNNETTTTEKVSENLYTEMLNASNALTYLNIKRIEGVGRPFSGKHSEWRTFKREMERDLKRTNSWDEILDIMEKRCKGRALTTMRANRDRYGDDSKAYEETMNAFEKLYGNPRLILRDLYDKLTRDERARWNSTSLHDLYIDVYDGLLADNESEEWKTKLNGRETVELIIRKRLPEQSRKHLAGKMHRANKISMSYQELLDFILEEINRTTHFMYEEFVDKDNKADNKHKRTPKKDDRQMNYMNNDDNKTKGNGNPSGSGGDNSNSPGKYPYSKGNGNPRGSGGGNHNSPRKYPCPACRKYDGHSLDKCPKFKSLDLPLRWNIVKTKGRCSCCLVYGHISKFCQDRKQCSICKDRFHHPVLCRGPTNGSAPNNVHVTQSDENNGTVHHVVEKIDTEDLPHSDCNLYSNKMQRPRYIPVTNVVLRCKGSDKSKVVTMLIDTGSDLSLLMLDTAKSLEVEGQNERLSITTANGTTTYDALVSDFEIRGIHDDTFYELKGVRCMDGLQISHSNPLNHHWDYEEYPHLSDLNLPVLDSAVVQLVIGTCHPMLQSLTDPIFPVNGRGPVVKKSLFGYLVVGSEDTSCYAQHHSVNRMHKHDVVCSGNADTCNLLHEQITDYFYSEYYDDDEDDICPSIDDIHANKIIEESTVDRGDKWEMSLPFKDESFKLPNNCSYALKRLNSLVRQLKRDPKLCEFYCNKMKELMDKHLQRVGPLTEEMMLDSSGLLWYVSHFATKQVKPRVVYDGPAEFRGCSLNSCLYDGPDIVQKLWEVLIRFREGKVAFTFDLKNMFMSVGIIPKHRTFLRILWFSDPFDLDSEIIVFMFEDLIYGLNCSSFLATLALIKTALLNPTQACLRAVEMTGESYYVDDCLDSVKNAKTAIEMVLDHFKLLESRNFKAHKFVSNSREVLQAIPKEYLADNMVGINLDFEDLPQQRILGISWDPETDDLVVNVNIVQMPLTKRGLWSMISQIYDPLGFCSPFLLPGRRILQELCRTVKEWDTEIPQDILKKWVKWSSGLKQLEKIRIKRCYTSLENVESYELHSFCDASTTGKGFVTYLRSINADEIEVSIVAGKSLVVPADNNTTVPKLELLAANLCAKQHARIKRVTRLDIDEEYLWSDSSTVLDWLNDTSKRQSKFVSRKLDRIRKRSNVENWRYVPSELNPADHSSRGIMPAKADPDHVWFKGPAFLYERDKSLWPTLSQAPAANVNEMISQTNPEEEEACCVYHMLNEEDRVQYITPGLPPRTGTKLMVPIPDAYREILHKHSSSRDMCKMLVYRKRYVVKHWLAPAGIASEMDGGVTREELDSAMLDLVRVAQEDEFTFKILKEIYLFGFQKVLEKPSKDKDKSKLNSIRNLLPFVDDQFVLRVGGRMQNTNLHFDSVHQIILPRRHHLTQALVLEVHYDNAHFGHNFVLSKLMKKFWLIHGVCTVKYYIEDCLYCQERRMKRQEQVMAPLPVCRSEQPKYPFSHAGVDLWGPMFVQVKRSLGKRWGVMITCLATRAVHLELVEDLSTSGFIQSLMRFLNRRGQCTEYLYSDCGSNFKGADEEFKSILRHVDAKLLKELGMNKAVGSQKELNERVQLLDKSKIKSALSRRNVDIVWKFNTPTASSSGGSWERLIKDTKRILTVLLIKGMEGVPALNRRKPNDFELLTILTEIESIMNNRPLTKISDNPNDFQALTPQMILTGVLDSSSPVHCFNKPDEFRRNWRYSQIVAEQFWLRWLTLYLPWLQVRSKWCSRSPNVKVGDLVLCVDMKTEGRLDYPKAIVSKVFPDKSNVVRNVCIKFANGNEYERPIQKIVKLEIDNDTMNDNAVEFGDVNFCQVGSGIDCEIINYFAASCIID